MPQESIKFLLFFIYWNKWRIYSQGFRMLPKFIPHHPRPLIFIALTLEKTNTGSLGTVLFLLRNIPSSQRRRRETQPGVPSLSALSPGELPHMLPTVTPCKGGYWQWPCPAISTEEQIAGDGWGAERKGGRPPLDTASGEESGLWGGGGEGNEQLETPQPQQGSAPITLWVGPCSARALLWKRDRLPEGNKPDRYFAQIIELFLDAQHIHLQDS